MKKAYIFARAYANAPIGIVGRKIIDYLMINGGSMEKLNYTEIGRIYGVKATNVRTYALKLYNLGIVDIFNNNGCGKTMKLTNDWMQVVINLYERVNNNVVCCNCHSYCCRNCRVGKRE